MGEQKTILGQWYFNNCTARFIPKSVHILGMPVLYQLTSMVQLYMTMEALDCSAGVFWAGENCLYCTVVAATFDFMTEEYWREQK